MVSGSSRRLLSLCPCTDCLEHPSRLCFIHRDAARVGYPARAHDVLRIAGVDQRAVAVLDYVCQVLGQVNALQRYLFALEVLAGFVDAERPEVDGPRVRYIAHGVSHDLAGGNEPSGLEADQSLDILRVDREHGGAVQPQDGAAVAVQAGLRVVLALLHATPLMVEYSSVLADTKPPVTVFRSAPSASAALK